MIENIIITVIISDGLGGFGVMKSHDVCWWARFARQAEGQTKHPSKLVVIKTVLLLTLVSASGASLA